MTPRQERPQAQNVGMLIILVEIWTDVGIERLNHGKRAEFLLVAGSPHHLDRGLLVRGRDCRSGKPPAAYSVVSEISNHKHNCHHGNATTLWMPHPQIEQGAGGEEYGDGYDDVRVVETHRLMQLEQPSGFHGADVGIERLH